MDNITDITNSLWTLLVSDLTADPHNYPTQQLLLAHYTSIEVFEKIVKDDEIWFSNPLFMNDINEIKVGITEGYQVFRNSMEIQAACGNTARVSTLIQCFDYYFSEFTNKHVFDIYAFCLSVHELEDYPDGKLSMWRGYGGNGLGAALVFDMTKVNAVAGSPLVISKVYYKSQAERLAWLNEIMRKISYFITNNNIPDDKLYGVAHIAFERIKIAAIYTKHQGFSEEKEWRVVYLKERDVDNKYIPTLGHIITKRGVEPKLRFKVLPTAGLTADDFSLNKLIDKIILGPSISDRLAYESVLRLLDNVKKPELKEKIICSTIPYRY